MTNLELAKRILELVGGKENVVSAANCMTRLRPKLKDPSKVDIEALKDTDGILGVVDNDGRLQIVLGPGKAKKVTDIFVEEAGVKHLDDDSSWQENKAVIKESQKQGWLKIGLQNIANIFIPMIPAIIAAGLFNGIASLINQSVAPSAEIGGFWFMTYTVCSLIGGAFLSYFAIFTGINAAKQFGATPALGGMLGAMSIMAQIVTISTQLGLYNTAVPLESILTTGKGGILGVIFGVWLLSKVERFVRKIIPDIFDLILTPFITLLVMSIVFVLVTMPVAGFLSDLLVSGLNVLINSSNAVISVISGFVLAAAFLPMVLLGLHHGLIPIYSIQLESLGGVTLFPVLAMAGAGQVGAAIALYLKCRKTGNQRLKKTIVGALPAGFLGVGEPLIYGVTLPLGKPFITAGLGAGFGGAFVRLMGVMSGAWGPSGLVGTPLMVTGVGGNQMFNYVLGLVISYIMGFIVTFIFIKERDLVPATNR